MSNTTHLEGYRTAAEAKAAAAVHQVNGYTTVQIGPTAFVQVQPGTPSYWPNEDGKVWYVVVASKDPMTNRANYPQAGT